VPRYYPKASVHVASRGAFLSAIKQYEPEVLSSLRDLAFSCFRSVPPAAMEETDGTPNKVVPGRPGLPLIWKSGNLEMLSSRYAQVEALRRALAEWARTNMISDEWFLDLALVTLYLWAQHDELLDALDFGPLMFTRPPVASDRFEVNYSRPGWDILNETRAQARKRLIEEFAAYLDSDYFPQVDAEMQTVGWEEAPEMRQLEHYRWLVLFHFKKWSPGKIVQVLNRDRAAGDKVNENNVFKAIQKTARLVNFTLRPSRRLLTIKPDQN
jgi:hypothetical protein